MSSALIKKTDNSGGVFRKVKYFKSDFDLFLNCETYCNIF